MSWEKKDYGRKSKEERAPLPEKTPRKAVISTDYHTEDDDLDNNLSPTTRDDMLANGWVDDMTWDRIRQMMTRGVAI